MEFKVSQQDILDAHARIKEYIHRTPILTSGSVNQITGSELYFKCENFRKLVPLRQEED